MKKEFTGVKKHAAVIIYHTKPGMATLGGRLLTA
jgi:arginine repressor